MHTTTEMVRIRGGPVLNEMVSNMVAIENKQATGKNILIYALGGDLEKQIPDIISYGDTIMVDLVKNGNSEPTVEEVYLDNATAGPKKYNLSVPSSVFTNAVKDMLVDGKRLDQLCGL